MFQFVVNFIQKLEREMQGNLDKVTEVFTSIAEGREIKSLEDWYLDKIEFLFKGIN